MRGFLIAAALILLAATVQAQSVSRLRYVETEKPDLLNPIDGARSTIGIRLLELVYRGLSDQDRSGQWIPEIAAEAPALAPGATEILVRIRDGATWPDGWPISANDVVFSFEYYREPENRYPLRDLLEIYERVEAVDAQTVRFVLRRSDVRAVYRLAFKLLPEHVLPGTVIPPTHGFQRRPMGCGPYAVTSVEPTRMVLGRNSNYPGARPSIEEIELQVNPDENVHLGMLMGGLVDLDPIVRPQDVPTLNANAMTVLRPYDSQAWAGFVLNCNHPALRVREVRQALNFLFDRPQALRAHLNGQGYLVSGPYTRSSLCYNPTVEPYPYDPGRGDSLLDSTGWVMNRETRVRERDGVPLRLRMPLSKQDSQANKNMCRDFEQQLAAHGVALLVDYQEDTVWQDRVFNQSDFDVTFLTWQFDAASNVYPQFASSEIAPGHYNVGRFADVTADALLDRFRNSVDEGERTDIGRRLHELLHLEAPYVFLWSAENNAAIRVDRVRRMNIFPFYFFRSIQDWEVAPSGSR
jgi:peptide/nickel transport system substrate-binding protein